MASSEAGQAALDALDGILARAPAADQALFSRATDCLCVFRDGLIEAGSDRRRLEHVNAVISIVMAGHFPLGKLPWEELAKARGWLVGALEEGSGSF